MEQTQMLFQDYQVGDKVYLVDWPISRSSSSKYCEVGLKIDRDYFSCLGKELEIEDAFLSNFSDNGKYSYNQDYIYKLKSPIPCELTSPDFSIYVSRNQINTIYKPKKIKSDILFNSNFFRMNHIVCNYSAYPHWRYGDTPVWNLCQSIIKEGDWDRYLNLKPIKAEREKVKAVFDEYRWQFFDFIENFKEGKLSELVERKTSWMDSNEKMIMINNIRGFHDIHSHFQSTEDYRDPKMLRRLAKRIENTLFTYFKNSAIRFLDCFFEGRNEDYNKNQDRYVIELYLTFQKAINDIYKKQLIKAIEYHNSVVPSCVFSI